MKRLFCAALALGFSLACGDKSSSSASGRHYHMTGVVKALDAKQHIANVDAAAIPNYMEAMTMDYPVGSQAEFNKLRVGEHIDAIINVHSDDSFDLSDIRPSESKK